MNELYFLVVATLVVGTIWSTNLTGVSVSAQGMGNGPRITITEAYKCSPGCTRMYAGGNTDVPIGGSVQFRTDITPPSRLLGETCLIDNSFCPTDVLLHEVQTGKTYSWFIPIGMPVGTLSFGPHTFSESFNTPTGSTNTARFAFSVVGNPQRID